MRVISKTIVLFVLLLTLVSCVRNIDEYKLLTEAATFPFVNENKLEFEPAYIGNWHPGNTEASQIFQEYLTQSFTREQVMQFFTEYALNKSCYVKNKTDDGNYVPTENVGLTGANVRLYFPKHEDVLYPAYRQFDLNQSDYYHEIVVQEDGVRIIFTAESAVRDFRFLRIMWNDDFFREDADEGKRLYNVIDVLHFLEELTPEIPLVINGANMGCALAANGFSFADEDGAVRYFFFQICGKTGFLVVIEF